MKKDALKQPSRMLQNSYIQSNLNQPTFFLGLDESQEFEINKKKIL